MRTRRAGEWLFLSALLAAGCASPYAADRGAPFGGVMGAGLGGVAGAAVGDPLAGAAIGAVAGTMTGAVVGGAIDDVEARNRAEIAARLGRPAPAGAVTVPDVVSMTQAGVNEQVIATHVRSHGLIRPLTTNDIIYLQQNGVTPLVVQTMQQSPTPVVVQQQPLVEPVPVYPAAPAYVIAPQPAPVVVVDPFVPPPPRWRHHHHHGPQMSWGVSVTSDRF